MLIDYTSRSLTFPSDRLLAIARVAGKFGKLFNDKYMAGMWQRTLTKDLGWYRHEREEDSSWQKCQTLGLELAPSWSWAKMEQGFIGTNPITDPDIEIISHDVTRATLDYGIFAARGQLSLRGTTIEVSEADCSNLVGFKHIMDDEPAAIVAGAKYLCLGFTFLPWMVIGLIIEPTQGSCYRRVGRIQIREQLASQPPKQSPYIWGQAAARKQTIKIV